jgi:cytoskeletal protein RodZ
MPRVPEDVSRRNRVPPRPSDKAGQDAAEGGAVGASSGASGGAGTGGNPPGPQSPRRQPPWDKPSEPETASFGDWLRRQREMREISLRDIADRTKISLRYLEAMEADRFDLLPAPIFAKGFLREYARYVGLSPDEVINHYLAVQQPQVEDKGDETLIGKAVRARGGRSWTYGLFLALAVLLLLGVVALLAYYNDRRQGSSAGQTPPPSMAAPPEPTVQPTIAPAKEAPTAPIELTLDFTADCWVEATVDGKTQLAEQRVQGESLQLQANQTIALKLGKASAVDIQVNGVPYAIPKDQVDGEVARLTFDLPTVQALKQSKEAH